MLAGGATSMVAMLALPLAGAAAAGIGPTPLLTCAAGLLAAGAAGLSPRHTAPAHSAAG